MSKVNNRKEFELLVDAISTATAKVIDSPVVSVELKLTAIARLNDVLFSLRDEFVKLNSL